MAELTNTPNFHQWTHNVLEHLYDAPLLERHVRDVEAGRQFSGWMVLQQAVLEAIAILRPQPTSDLDSLPQRIYQLLELHYVQCMTQAQVATRMNLDVRTVRRIQHKAIESVAAVLKQRHHLVQPTPSMQDSLPAPTWRAGRVHLRDLLANVLNMFKPIMQRRNLDLQVISPAALPPVSGNRVQMRQLLISSMDWLMTDLQDQSLELILERTGNRIRLHLQKPCAKISTCASDESEPLNSVQMLASELHADVLLRHASVTHIELIVSLPVCDAQVIVMLDDNRDAIQLVHRYLQQTAEYEFIGLSRSDELLQNVIDFHPLCVLMDVMMPDQDGWEMLTLLKAHPETSLIPVILSSVIKEHQLAFELGASAVLPKPFTAAQLLETLHSIVPDRE